LLTYKIQKPKAPRKLGQVSDKQTVLSSYLAKCPFMVGDKVKFKKPRRNPVTGIVLHIENEPENVTWSHGGFVPMFIVLSVDKIDKATGLVYGYDRVKTTTRKITLLEDK